MTTTADTTHLTPRKHARIAVGIVATAYLVSLAALQREPGASLVEPLFLLALLGIAFPLLAWALTRTPRIPATPVAGEPSRLPAVLLYLAAFSVLVFPATQPPAAGEINCSPKQGAVTSHG